MIGEFICMFPSDMNLWIGKVKNYNNKILISSPSFNIGTNVKINVDGEKDKPDAKPKGEGIVKTKPNIKPNKECKQDVKPNIEFDKISYEEEKVALVFGMTFIFTVWWMFK